MNERDDGGVADPADAAMLQVVDRQAQQIGEVEEIFRHASSSGISPTPERESPRAKRRRSGNPDFASLYIGFGRLISICRKAGPLRQELNDSESGKTGYLI